MKLLIPLILLVTIPTISSVLFIRYYNLRISNRLNKAQFNPKYKKGGKKGIKFINELLKRHKVPDDYIRKFC